MRGWKPSSAALEGVLHGVLPSSRCAALGCAAKAFSLFLRASVIGLVARVLLTSFLISFAFFPCGLSGRDQSNYFSIYVLTNRVRHSYSDRLENSLCALPQDPLTHGRGSF